jgi:hypothetical protein
VCCSLVLVYRAEDEKQWYGVAGGCFTDVVLHSSINYRRSTLQSHAGCEKMLQPVVEPILCFHGVSNLHEVLTCADNSPFTAPSSNAL